MINLRGNSLSREHISEDADSSAIFWDFTFEEFGEKDIPAAIEEIILESDYDKVSVIAYSQGTTAALFGASNSSKSHESYHQNVNSIFLLAPAVYFRGMEIEALCKIARNQFLFDFLYQFGYFEIAGTEPWLHEGYVKRSTKACL